LIVKYKKYNNQGMPNWCTNSLTLTGKKEWIDALTKKMETDDEDIFMYLRPCMEDAEWYSDKWYSWNCDNWGTKWDANEVMIGSSELIKSNRQFFLSNRL